MKNSLFYKTIIPHRFFSKPKNGMHESKKLSDNDVEMFSIFLEALHVDG